MQIENGIVHFNGLEATSIGSAFTALGVMAAVVVLLAFYFLGWVTFGLKTSYAAEMTVRIGLSVTLILFVPMFLGLIWTMKWPA